MEKEIAIDVHVTRLVRYYCLEYEKQHVHPFTKRRLPHKESCAKPKVLTGSRCGLDHLASYLDGRLTQFIFELKKEMEWKLELEMRIRIRNWIRFKIKIKIKIIIILKLEWDSI